MTTTGTLLKANLPILWLHYLTLNSRRKAYGNIGIAFSVQGRLKLDRGYVNLDFEEVQPMASIGQKSRAQLLIKWFIIPMNN